MHGRVAERRCAELVAVRRVSRDLLKAEIFVLPGAVINHVRFSYAEERSDLRNAYHMHLEVAEHLVGLPGHLVTLDTPAFSEKDHPAFFLRNGHRLFVATRKPVDRSIGKCQSKQCKGNFACVKFRLLP